ncbi:hypothetical protein ACJIZ3_011424 [Penstemon smallii]|uniref:Uncharacterized protein n=1 Tax=Penstemon smallii TaxID=265156 RepID=A0ABD3UJ89_9LAMI
MDNQRGLLLNWNCFYQEKSMDEIIRQSLFLTMELEETKLKAQEELKNKDEQISQLKKLLETAINERNEAQENFQKLFLEKLHSENSKIEDEPTRVIESNNGFSSSISDESIVSSPPPQELPIMVDRELPEKGKLLEAVMKAGPLLQTLLLAGPLPQWRHPPPPLEIYQIPPPPVVIPSLSVNQDLLFDKSCGKVNRKRGLSHEGSDSSSIDFKYQRAVLQ